jgi:cardiolipin synthase
MQTPILYLIEAHLFTVVVALLMFALIARVLSNQRRPSASAAWILAIVLIPYVGIPAYLLFGGRKIRAVRRHKHTLHQTRQDPRVRLLEFDHPAEDVLTSEGVRPPSARNRVDFITDGVTAYERLLRLVEEAKRSIYVETYVLHNDDVSRAIIDAMARKAAAGLDVRLLIDSYGSFFTSNRCIKPLRKAGGHVARFLPLLPTRRNWSLNLRNHRKIIVADGRRASIGGMNLGAPYLGPTPDPDRWIDTAVIIEGPAVSDVLEVFCSDWNFASRTSLDMACAQVASAPETDGDDIVQIAASGPDVAGDPLYEAMLASIHAARERIWVVTPYFAPGDELFRALLIQARIGRDVRLLMPARSNHFVADLVRGPYLRQLAAAGGTVLLHAGPMIHAKNIVFDETTAVTGTINFDLRSLYLNFEVALFAYNRARVRQIAAWMEGYMRSGVRLSQAPPPRARQLMEQVSFLFSPLL